MLGPVFTMFGQNPVHRSFNGTAGPKEFKDLLKLISHSARGELIKYLLNYTNCKGAKHWKYAVMPRLSGADTYELSSYYLHMSVCNFFQY